MAILKITNWSDTEVEVTAANQEPFTLDGGIYDPSTQPIQE